jgi:hypothetical protein
LAAAVFLDTRTKRTHSLTQANNLRQKLRQELKGPELISSQERESVTAKLAASGWTSGKELVVVSPVPFYGLN